MGGKYPIHIVDVFAERALAGNQLAVVRAASDLTDEQMLSIAQETNFSETTFVLSEGEGRAQVRIFTPGTELPFAGHPTVGTAWVVTEGRGAITLDLPVGPVPVEFIDGIGWMVLPEVAFEGSLSPDDAAALIGLASSDLAPDFPVALAQVGPAFVLIPVADLDTLKRAKLDPDVRQRLLASGVAARSVFVFSPQSYGPDADFAARMFFDANGIREDPATGSANGAFAAYLLKHRGELGRVIVDQGVEMARPSRLYLDVAATLRVGGKVQPVIHGELTIT